MRGEHRLLVSLAGCIVLCLFLSLVPVPRATSQDALSTVSFSLGEYPIGEGDGQVTLTVVLSPAAVDPVTVDYATANGSATAPADYTATSDTLTFLAGETQKTIPVTIINDGWYEGNETFTVSLSNAIGAALGTPNQATVTISDNESSPVVRFTSNSYSANEGDGSVTITVELSPPSQNQVTVDYSTANGTATAPADYTTASNTLTFLAGETQKTIPVTIINDGWYEGNETFTIGLSNAIGAALGTPNQATITINDNESSPVVRFTSGTYSANENAGSVTITVELSPASQSQVTVDYATANGSATAPADYTTASNTLTFLAGETQKTIPVTIINDGWYEGNETFTVSLSNAIGAALGTPNQTTVTINDNESSPVVRFTSSSYSANENAGSVTLTVEVSPPSQNQVTVDYATANGTATAPADYTTASNTLTFLAGETQKTIPVTIINDGWYEGNETFTVSLSNAIGAALGTPNQTTVTINDNESSPVVRFTSSSYGANENAGSLTLTVELSLSSQKQITVDYATANATAMAPADYLAASDTLTFLAGETQKTIPVTIINDDWYEGDETFTVSLSNASNAALGTPNQATVTILDDNVAGVQVAPLDVDVIEGGSTDQYQVVLTSEPTDPVTINVTTDGQTTVSPSQLVFSGTNWDQGKTITVSAVDDSIAEGPHSSTIIHTSSSNDDDYNGLQILDVTASIQDNDGAEILVDPVRVEVSEPSGTATFTIRLTSNPKYAVTIPLATSNNQCSVSLAAAVINASNWNSGVSVSVFAVDDTAEEGDHICVVETGNSISDDTVYDNRTVPDVVVTVHDDGDRQVFLPLAPSKWPPVPGTPALQPISNVDGDGAYTITWTRTERAETYTLEQARDSAFTTAIKVYDGPSTSQAQSGQVTGRHYYRVKAHNSSGDSLWSAAQWVDVLWEVEPNNLPPDANGPLVSGLVYFGRFLSGPTPLEYDYYYFDLPAAGRVELWLRNIPGDQDYNLVLRDANYAPVGDSAWGGNASEHIVKENLPAGRYFAQVWHYAGGGSSQAYHLQVLY